MPRNTHPESHRQDRIGWLRAAVLGANDGIVSTASLMVGIAAANATTQTLLLTGIAALVAGAMSMAAGEYVSVSSQADTEAADIARERTELAEQPEHELRELAGIYQARGLSPELASQVAQQLMKHDALGAHARDELGISSSNSSRPVQAALASAASFATGAALPMITALFAPSAWLVPTIGGASLIFLILLGWVSAHLGGAPVLKAVMRVAFWGLLAMGITAGVGAWFGVAA
ncbi:VIT family protein [Variovorax sp. PCZ-1]|uniref:VIT1/CCC1 transporter family protein n=1 Tax=Variovorax sp. PCZ-1 TaxID=2835533 RepID=UPI001BD06AFE|nr:VIT family protein [Variovorax sp. PCZ-1]MBS7807694.1 VIT family protein [Variovorax sp. PCZ-1]